MHIKKQFDLTRRVAIVAGGAGRLGPKLIESLHEAGAHVIVADIKRKQGSGTILKSSSQAKPSIKYFHADITNSQSVQFLINAVFNAYRRIDIVVNACMAMNKHFYSSVDNYSRDDWDHSMSVNVWGSFLMSREAAKIMRRKKKGAIINIGSIYGVVGADQRVYGASGINSPAVYAASKGAIINLTRYLAVYWARFGIRVNSISPGGIYDNQDADFVKKYGYRTPLNRMVNKDELKGAMLYLASDASSAVTGQNLMVDGGWTAW